MARDHEFSQPTKQQALVRQRNQCASCGERIEHLNQTGRESHKFGEGAHAHHVKHIQQGGQSELANCVIVCESCHYALHEGGNYRSKAIRGTVNDFPHYRG